MHRIFSVGVVLCLVGAFNVARDATVVVNFDDINVPGGQGVPMPENYGGISWEPLKFGIIGLPFPGEFNSYSKPNAAFVSNNLAFGPNDLMNETVRFSFASGAVLFYGVYISGNGSVANNMRVDLFKNNILVYSTQSFQVAAAPSLFGNGYNGLVTKVSIVGPRFYYVIDDVTYQISRGGTVIPEPSTWMLMILGFGLIAQQLRRRHMVGASLAA